MRTYVLATTSQRAIQMCRENGIRPFSNFTTILSPTQLHMWRGIRARAHDRVLIEPELEQRAEDDVDLETALQMGGFRRLYEVWEAEAIGLTVKVERIWPDDATMEVV